MGLEPFEPAVGDAVVGIRAIMPDEDTHHAKDEGSNENTCGYAHGCLLDDGVHFDDNGLERTMPKRNKTDFIGFF
jgi:hypothetical protein